MPSSSPSSNGSKAYSWPARRRGNGAFRGRGTTRCVVKSPNCTLWSGVTQIHLPAPAGTRRTRTWKLNPFGSSKKSTATWGSG
eukprot:5152481-Pyramimonas_sp.AAC.1